jgi:phosphonate degradation associated HDIG domain protein
MRPTEVKAILRELFMLYECYGAEAYGEEVTQTEHMVQAAQLAEREGHDEEVVLAAFLHDIGHLHASAVANPEAGAYGTTEHAQLGSDYLRRHGFSDRLVRLVKNHVQAKRYLTFAQPGYYDKLSEASRHTLRLQGGPMDAAEAQIFEQDALFTLSLRMRHWDEAAKEAGRPVTDLSEYRERCRRYLLAQKRAIGEAFG